MMRKAAVKTSTLILSAILLLAIITLAYGYYQNNLTVIYGGIAAIFIISIMITFQNILFKKEAKRKSGWINREKIEL